MKKCGGILYQKGIREHACKILEGGPKAFGTDHFLLFTCQR